MTTLERITAILERARVAGGWDDEVVARAVLREMVAPDQEMIEAANEAVYQTREPPAQVDVVWRAMCVAALNEKPETE